MKKSRIALTTSAIGALVLGATGILVTSVPNTALADAPCHKINAKGTGQDLGTAGTTADITGGGLLHGTTEGHFTPMPTTDPNVVTLAGTVTFTTDHGTLTVTVAGTFNTTTGDFTASGPVTDSTGKLAGATGSLKFTGNDDLMTHTFTETVDGRVCVDLGP